MKLKVDDFQFSKKEYTTSSKSTNWN